MDDSIFIPELDKAIRVIKNYTEILEKKVIDLGNENKELKIKIHDLHNEIKMSKNGSGGTYSAEYAEELSGHYKDGGEEFSSGFLKRVKKAEEEREQIAKNKEIEEMRRRWVNMRIDDL